MARTAAAQGRERVQLEDEDRKRRALERCALFSHLSESLLSDTLRKLSLARVDRRGRLGDVEPATLWVLASGRVRVVRKSLDGRDITLDYYGAGEVIGEEALVEDNPPLKFLAVEQVEAVRVPLAVARELLERDGTFAYGFATLLGERKVLAEKRIERLLTKPVESRVAHLLLEGARRYGVPDSRGTLIGVKFTHLEIASYVGSTRETVTLILGDFKRAGLILIDHRRIIVTDLDALEARS
jgi:CRP/FNR family transcriptional regulator, cyclic AMP receptor protein